MARTVARIRKSDLTPAFEAAKAAGYPYVDITIEKPDGSLVRVRASNDPEPTQSDEPRAELEAWKARSAKA